MDISASQYNSAAASESGWTHYLDQSSLSEHYFQMKGARMEEEQDLSMLSDASSGPPHYHDDDDECFCEDWYPCVSSSQYTKNCEKKKKVKEYISHQQPSHLDDTASSSVFSCPKKKVNFSGTEVAENALGFSQGFCATGRKGKPKFQKQHSSFLECSLAGKQASEEPGAFVEEQRK